jgi:hypothetical protein
MSLQFIPPVRLDNEASFTPPRYHDATSNDIVVNSLGPSAQPKLICASYHLSTPTDQYHCPQVISQMSLKSPGLGQAQPGPALIKGLGLSLGFEQAPSPQKPGPHITSTTVTDQ